MEEELQTLLDDALSFPVKWGVLPADATLPRASMFRMSGSRDMHLDGTGLMETRVQIDCFGETYAEAITASRQVRTALEGYRGGVIQKAFLDAVRDGFNDDTDLVERVSLTFALTYTE